MTRNDSIISMPLIDAAIARHGARAVLIAALGAMLRPAAAKRDALPGRPDLPVNDHLRRDIGLHPNPPPKSWELIR
jgi:hypothetical protein